VKYEPKSESHCTVKIIMAREFHQGTIIINIGRTATPSSLRPAFCSRKKGVSLGGLRGEGQRGQVEGKEHDAFIRERNDSLYERKTKERTTPQQPGGDYGRNA